MGGSSERSGISGRASSPEGVTAQGCVVAPGAAFLSPAGEPAWAPAATPAGALAWALAAAPSGVPPAAPAWALPGRVPPSLAQAATAPTSINASASHPHATPVDGSCMPCMRRLLSLLARGRRHGAPSSTAVGEYRTAGILAQPGT